MVQRWVSWMHWYYQLDTTPEYDTVSGLKITAQYLVYELAERYGFSAHGIGVNVACRITSATTVEAVVDLSQDPPMTHVLPSLRTH